MIPQHDGEQLEKLERVDNLVFEDVREWADGNFEDIVIEVVGLQFACDQFFGRNGLQDWFHSVEGVPVWIEVEFSLLEVKEVEVSGALPDLLHEEFTDPIHSLDSGYFLAHQNMARFFYIC